MRDRAYNNLDKPPGADGAVDLTMAEFGQILDYEVAATQMKSNLREGFENLPVRETLWEARYADTLFYGTYGGVQYRINRAGKPPIDPYSGGDFNYLKQGMTFKAAGDARATMHGLVRAWSASGAGTYSNTSQRLFFSGLGHYYHEPQGKK